MDREQYENKAEVMWEEENYLEALRSQRGTDQISECTNAKFSDFTFGEIQMDEDKKEFLSALQVTGKTVLEQMEREEKPTNARICVKIDKDEMATWIFLFPPFHGGREITEELIMDVLDECGVTYGINRTMIKQATNTRAYLKLFPAAEGTQPVIGVAGSIIDHYPREQVRLEGDEELLLEEAEKEFHRWKGLHRVSEGDVICDVHLPQRSQDGMTVTGKILLGEDIPLLELPIGDNVGFNESKTSIVSKINGTLVFDQGKFTVNDIQILFSDIDVTTGNVNVIGNLEIHGDVQSGLQVSATGNIHVYGMVGNATVTAGGNIVIDMGVRGIDKGMLKAGGSIYCKYMENCVVTAKGHIVTDSVINCKVRSDEFVDAQKLVGGSVCALHKVSAKVIGIEQRRETIVYLGLTQETLNERILLENRTEELDGSLKELVKGIRQLKSKKKLDVDSEARLYQMMNAEIAQKHELEEHMERLVYLEHVINDVSECQMTANLIYPPLKVMMRSDSILINRVQNMCRVWSDDGEIRMS